MRGYDGPHQLFLLLRGLLRFFDFLVFVQVEIDRKRPSRQDEGKSVTQSAQRIVVLLGNFFGSAAYFDFYLLAAAAGEMARADMISSKKMMPPCFHFVALGYFA